MKKVLLISIFATVLSVAESASAARKPPVPARQWNPDVQLWLARAMVAEAGWLHDRDHVAIAYVLARRWDRMTERYPTMRFLDVIRNYCAGLGGFRRSLTPRQVWLRGLWPEARQPEGWPRKASWRRHAPLWRAALERAGRFAQGELRDPCRGRAWHWGGTIDSPRGRMEAVDCGETANTFYRLVPRTVAAR